MLHSPKTDFAARERLNVIDDLVREWRRRFPRTLEMRLAQRSYDEDFLIRMAYNSNALEGSTLTLADTEIIYEGEFVEGKPGREQAAARGIFEGSDFLERRVSGGGALDEPLLRDLHERSALDLQPAARGMYRNAPAIIRASRAVPAAPLKIRDEMANLFYQHAEAMGRLHPLTVIPWFHAALEGIHPFADGNGRTGRLWMNGQLRERVYPPICIKADHGAEYKSGLEAWQVDGDPRPFNELFLRCIQEELERRLDFLRQGPAGEAVGALSPQEAEALGIVCSLPSVTARKMGEVLGLSERQAQRLIRNLREAGLIFREGSAKRGAWRLSEREG